MLINKRKNRIFEVTEENSRINTNKLIFKLIVVDALLYYDKKRDRYQEPYCEIEISNNNYIMGLFEQIKENERVRIYNIKATPKLEKKNKYYDFHTKTTYNKLLFLQTTKNTMIQPISTIKEYKTEINNFKQFAKDNFSNYNLLTQIDINKQSLSHFYKNELQNYNNEVDVVGLVLETSQNKIYGLLSNKAYFMIEV